MVNATMDTIKKRRSITNFLSKQIDDKKLNSILEAGRWAPSWANKQPWKFIVVSDETIRSMVSRIVPSVFGYAIRTAPLFIAVCVNPDLDPYHYIEEGAAATQNMALAAHSLGLGTIWMGTFSLKDERDSNERKIKEILKIPKKWRLISVLPVGYPKFQGHKTRKELENVVNWNYFSERNDLKPRQEIEYKEPRKKSMTPSSSLPY